MLRKQVTIRLDSELWRQVRVKALEEGMSAQAAVEDGLRWWLIGQQPAHPHLNESSRQRIMREIHTPPRELSYDPEAS